MDTTVAAILECTQLRWRNGRVKNCALRDLNVPVTGIFPGLIWTNCVLETAGITSDIAFEPGAFYSLFFLLALISDIIDPMSKKTPA